MAVSRRKAPGRRWSATSTVEWYDRAGTRIQAGSSAEPAKAAVRYRLDGHSKKYTCSGADLSAQVRSTQALLTLAYEQDWDADLHGRPVARAALPAVGVHTAGHGLEDAGTAPIGEPDGAHVLCFPGSEESHLAASPTGAALPAAGVQGRPADIATLVQWRTVHLTTTKSHRAGSGRRSPTTTGNYDTNLQFLLAHARYREGDPRLTALGLPPGTPMRLDEPELGMNEHDLVALLTLRGTTNLRIKAANERCMARWATAVDKEERAAARAGRDPVLPTAPELREESVEERTVEGFAQTVRSALKDGYLHQKIGYQPWTLAVEAEVPHAATPHYSSRTLPTREQVHLIAGTLREMWRRSTTAGGHPCSVTGARYQGLVVLAGREGLRPEESIAVRRSWVHLDDGDPRVELHWAEVYHPCPGGGRVRTRVPLKGRQPGEIRVVRLLPDTVEALRAHEAKFVSQPDPMGATEELRDPYYFTTHTGAPIDLGTFSRVWFKPAVIKAFANPADQHLLGTPFRRLRAAAVTDWILGGASSGEASEKAGNTAAVIEKHYRGVFAARPRGRVGSQSMTAGADLAIARLDDLQLAELTQAVMTERRHRLERDAQLVGGVPQTGQAGP